MQPFNGHKNFLLLKSVQWAQLVLKVRLKLGFFPLGLRRDVAGSRVQKNRLRWGLAIKAQ
tara:strand:+ start:119590 stop:119769 length:180 start_codon:yes stop_codon:yes gene_type:complete